MTASQEPPYFLKARAEGRIVVSGNVRPDQLEDD
jgi:hypothetical protein